MSHTAVYHYFANKEALVVGVADHGFAALIASLEGALARGMSGTIPQPPGYEGFFALMEVTRAYTGFALAAPSRFRFMYGTAPHAEQALSVRHGAVLALFSRAVEFAQERGLVRRGPPSRYAAQLWALVHGVATLTLADALDGVPRGRRDKQSDAKRTKRARDLTQGAIAAIIMGMRDPGATLIGLGDEA